MADFVYQPAQKTNNIKCQIKNKEITIAGNFVKSKN